MYEATPWRRWLADGPLDSKFWLGEIDARMPAVFRAGLAAILLCDALMAVPDLQTLYGTHGVWPAALAGGPLVALGDDALLAVWIAGCSALLALMFGLWSRLSATLSWAFLVAIHQRNPGITTGGDYLAQILLFFCIWLDTGAAWSVDAWRLGRSRRFVAAAPWRAMQLHLAILYFVTARLKIRGGWLSGDGVYLGLQHLGFLRPVGAWFLAHPALCRVSTYGILALEMAFPFLAFFPLRAARARLGAVACAAAVQMGILTTMRVGMFTALMLWTCVLFLPARPGPAAQTPGHPRRWAIVALCASVVAAMAWGPFAGKRLPMPRAVDNAMAALGLVQPFDLFGCTYEVAQWRARGVRHDGADVDVLAVAAPGLRSEVAWRFSALYKLTFAGDADHVAIAGWLCREYAETTGEPLRSIVLSKHAREPVRPGEDRPYEDVDLYAGTCAM
jgi:hypothetical protein